ncbi:ATP-dependent endonuclease [Aeromicrobium sp.]|uniref:ATP-dependent endonuclease n=1 Tax=Aeromicrobium sp. TaxID=1871063 RepID=UPI002FCB4AE3
MHDMTRLRDAIVVCAAGRDGADAAGEVVRELVGAARTIVLVEGVSDAAALLNLSRRRGRDLDAEGICVVPMGGATSIGRYLELLSPLGVGIAGLSDRKEWDFYVRALERAGLGTDGFFVCDPDLEYELIRVLGVDRVEQVIEEQGDLPTLRIFQRQPAQRPRSVEHQLHRWFGSIGGRKERYAGALVDALDLANVPRPLDELLAYA